MNALLGLIIILFLFGFIVVAVVGIAMIFRAVLGPSVQKPTPPAPRPPKQPLPPPLPWEPPPYEPLEPYPPAPIATAPPPPPVRLPYQRQYQFLSKAERSFYGVLCQAIPDTQVVMAKVRLADIIKVKKGTGEFYNWHNKIDRKHLDFVICNRDTMQIDFCVELDDNSHDLDHRKERDAFVDSAMEAAEIPLIHIRCQHTYNLDEVRRQLSRKNTEDAPAAAAPLPGNTEPLPSTPDEEYENLKARLRGQA